MDKKQQLATLTLLTAMVVASCGGGGSSSSVAPTPSPPPPPPPSGPSDADRIAAATATASTNPKCSEATLGTYYWEIGDSAGAKASGSVGGTTASTSMWVFSASKWLYAASVVQKRGGVTSADVPFLNFTSGYTQFGNEPLCLGSTVETCHAGWDVKDTTTVGRFDYDSGHMQFHAASIMGMGQADDAALASDLNVAVGNFGFSYTEPQLAAGVVATPQGYATFLRRLLGGQLKLASALGTNKVCAQQAAAGCNAAFTPDSIGTEAWNYSLGHWVEDDPTVGDHAFSSAGGGGFYPWIDSTKTYYGIVARERETESAAGYHSAECGRLLRQAWRTGLTVTATTPTPN